MITLEDAWQAAGKAAESRAVPLETSLALTAEGAHLPPRAAHAYIAAVASWA